MAIRDRLKRLEDANPPTCKGNNSPCQLAITITEVEYIGGVEVLLEGTPAEPLCDECPHHGNKDAPISEIEVMSYDGTPPPPGTLVYP